jgi:hypothetical protein
MRLALLWMLAAQSGTVTVTGTASNAITHEPVQDVIVVLRSRGAVATAHSTAAGTFRIPDVQPGTYAVQAQRRGYDAPERELHIEAGADQTLDIAMTPWPSLSGRVLDSERQPVPDIYVRAFRGGEPGGVMEETGKDGRFTFERLQPGTYTLMAYFGTEARHEGPTEPAQTWYGDVTDSRDAAPITVMSGNDLTGYDIVLRRVPVFRITGKVLDDRGDPAAGAKVEMGVAQTTAREDGTFELVRVRRGMGFVSAELDRGGVKLRGSAEAAVIDHDVDNVRVRLAAPIQLAGTIELDGKPAHIEAFAILMGRGFPAQSRIAGSDIHFDDVYPGLYRLFLVPRGEAERSRYLDSVRLGETDVTGEWFDAAPGMPPIRVVLKSGGGQVRGQVENGDGGLIVLVPAEERLRSEPFLRTQRLEGSLFQVDHVRPGDYYVLAIKGPFDAGRMQVPDYAGPLLERAVRIKVEVNASTSLTLSPVSGK